MDTSLFEDNQKVGKKSITHKNSSKKEKRQIPKKKLGLGLVY